MLKVDGKKFDWANINLVDCLEGNALDTYFTLKIYDILRKDLEERKLIKLYEKLIAPLSTLFARIEYDGLLIDQDELHNLDIAISNKLESIVSGMQEFPEVKDDDNLASSRHLTRILFSLEKNKETKDYELLEDSGFGLYPPYQTPGGIPATDIGCLNKLGELLHKEIDKRGLMDG